jgi:hypothetical protein
LMPQEHTDHFKDLPASGGRKIIACRVECPLIGDAACHGEATAESEDWAKDTYLNKKHGIHPLYFLRMNATVQHTSVSITERYWMLDFKRFLLFQYRASSIASSQGITYYFQIIVALRQNISSKGISSP